MSTATKQPKKATARTTTIRITPPADFVLLAERYRLVRYVLPKTLIFSKDNSRYARLHNELKEQLDAPYRVYTYDELDGYRQWAVYVLYPRQDNAGEDALVPALRYEEDVLPGAELSFDKPKLHVLIKLLQIAYFRGEQNTNKNRFVGQDKCYVYAKRRGGNSDKYHICLEIDLKGDLQDENLFFVYGQARTFARQDAVDEAYSYRNTLYTFEIRDELLLFRQVKRSQVATTHPLYARLTFAGSRTTLDFHDQDEVAASRGYLVDTFIKGFVHYLTRYGFEVEHQRREFQKHVDGDAGEFQLPIDNLNSVYVIDQRFNPLYDLPAYVSVFQAQFPKLEFQIVAQITADCTSPVLVFQDCKAGAFSEEMPLYQQDDPHQRFYEQFPLVAKQFINVNGNIPDKGMSREDYLTYEMELPGEQQVLMALNELFLKDLILRKRDVITRLPLAPTNLMFVHLENRGRGENRQGYEVAMCFEGNTVRFLNLRSREESDEFYALMDSFDVDWGMRYDEMRDKYKKRGEDENLNTYDVIVGPGLFVEIEDAHEALLYEYEEILRRIAEYDQPFPLDNLKLAAKYNQLIGDPDLSEEMLQLRGYTQQPKPLQSPKTQKQREAVDLYFALQDYDKFLVLQPQIGG